MIGWCKPGAGARTFGIAERAGILASDWSEHWRRLAMSTLRQQIRGYGYTARQKYHFWGGLYVCIEYVQIYYYCLYFKVDHGLGL